MGGFPFGQTSHVCVNALADPDASIAGAVARTEAMMGGAPG